VKFGLKRGSGKRKKKEVWKVSEIARLLGVHRNTVVFWIQMGFLKAVDVSTGRKPSYRIHQYDLIEFLKERHSWLKN
jgi:excisionase family DNA binding protein